MKSFWIIGLLSATVLLLPSAVFSAQPVADTAAVAPATDYRAVGLAACAAFAIGLSVLGASYAVARIGSAALGAAAEKPELLARSLVLLALAEGLAVLGFAIAMLLLQKI